MQGRDLSAELFGPAPSTSPVGRDLSADLFGAPSATPAAAPAASVGRDLSADLFGAKAPAKKEERPEDQSFLRQVADVPLKVAGGAAMGVRMIADAFGADSSVSKNMRGVEDWIGELYSAQSKQDSKRMAQIMKEAEDKGVKDQIVAAVQAFKQAPVDLTVSALGTAAPAILAGISTFLLGAPAAVTTAAGLGVGALMGSGTIKSSIYDATKQTLTEQKDLKLTPEQIEKIAVEAQSYGGKNTDMILAGTILGAIGARTGAEPVIARGLAQQIIGKTVEKEAQQAVIKEGARKATEAAAKRGIVKQGLRTGATEFGTEFAQAGQEQLAQNIALQREGFDVPTMRGVVGQGTLEGLAGLGMGAVTGGRQAYTAKRELAAEQQPITDTEESQFTTEKQTKARTVVAPTAEDIDALTPITDRAGKPLVGAAPETMTAKEKADADAAAAAEAAKLSLDEATTKANELIAKVDGGGKMTRDELLAIGKGLGVPFKTTTSNKAKLEIIREHLAKQGAPSAATTGTDESAAGAGAGVAGQSGAVAPAAGPDTSGVVSPEATTGPATAGAGAQPDAVTPAAPAPAPAAPAATKTIADLSPELQAEVQRRQDEIAQIEASNGDASKKKKQLNALLAKQGISGTLSAKKSIEKDFLDEGELPYAVAGEEKTEQQQEQERVAAYEESLGETVPDYEISEEDQRLYNEMRDEVNSQVDAANERRRELVKQLDDAVAEYDALVDTDDDAKLQAAVEKAAAAEKALKDHGSVQRKLPEYTKKLSADYKDVYFGNITAGVDPETKKMVFASSKREHRKAAKALQEYLAKTGGREKEDLTAPQRRAINQYEENRVQYSKIFPVNFPRWQDLTAEQKEVFLREMVTNAGAQQDIAFAKLGLKLVEDSKQLSEGEKREKQNEINRKAEVAAQSEKTQAELEELRRKAPVGIGSSTLPDKVVQMIANNDLQGVLKYMSEVKTTALSSPFVRIRKALAEALLGLNLNTKIKIVENLGGDLAQYDPATDTILVTKEGLSNSTILHEIIHAGTVKVINEYLYGDRKSLSMGQLNAIKSLETIMKQTKHLASDHPDAYKNLFEFVSYALSDERLQNDLRGESALRAELRPGSLSKKHAASLFKYFGVTTKSMEDLETILPDVKSSWSEFKLAIARILKVRDTYLKKSGKLFEDVEPDYVMEVAAAFEDLLAKPTAPIYLPALPARRGAPAPAATTDVEEGTTPPERTGGINDPKNREFYELKGKEKIVSRTGQAWRAIRTAAGWRDIVRRFQDKSVESRSLHKKLDMSGLIKRGMDEAFNNFDELRDLATGVARNYLNTYLRVPMDSIKQLIGDYAKLTKKDLDGKDGVLVDLHMFSEMFHEPERRHFKWLRSVPLSTTKNLTHNGKRISAADRRIDILGDPRTGKPGLVDRVELTQAQLQQLRAELEYLAKNYADPLGDSPRIKSEQMRERVIQARKKKNLLGVMNIEEDNSTYNVLGINKAEVDLRRQQYDALDPKQRELLDKIFAEAKVITDRSAELDKIGNYWSYPVSNLVGLYDYQHYMPFKGVSKHSVVDQYLSFDSEATGKDMQDVAHSADGRFSVSDNPFLQMMSDAFRSAGRAGRRDYMQSIKNAVKPNKLNPTGTGVIDGEVVKHIEFAERNIVDLSEFKGGSNIFVYNSDGSIDIVRINEPKILNALRYSFRDASPMLDMANAVTGFFGAMHTRYNYNFAPLNFVRDALTNAWNIGASKLGPLKSAKYIQMMSAAIVKNGLGKAMEVAHLHEKGDPVSKRILLNAAKNDPFVRDMLEYLQFGGKTTYMESFSLKSSLQDLSTKLGKRRIMDNVDSFNQFVDVWNNMFEFTSRTAAFTLYKKEALKRNIDKGMSNVKDEETGMSPAEVAAGTEAAAWTKNLANFEKAGEYAREMGALYMFIRPSATGAVRAAEAALPAFRSMESALNDLPAEIRNDPAALEKFKKEYALERRNARIMITTLFGMGFLAYWMSSLMAPDDEWKRNNVKTDNMQQWTRFARFHIPNEVSQMLGLGRDVVFQLPWGFGLGAFAAIGAQFAGMTVGNSSFKDFFANSVVSMTDSFLPIPVSRMSPIESPESSLKWIIDSVAPTVVRPGIEFVMNTNGIGQAINSASTRRMGDAFTGGDRIPQIYKDAAEGLFLKTDGYLDWSPNTLYFFSNSYLDGLAKVGELGYSWSNLEKDKKEFNVKTDAALFGSFFGAKTNVDSREYGDIEKRIKELDKRLTTLDEIAPARAAKFDAENPLARGLVDAYKSRQGELNKLRAEANEIRRDPYLSPKDKQAMLRIATMQQNILKHEMVLDFKAYGEKP